MKILTKQELISGVPKSWFEQYKGYPKDSEFMSTYKKLLALGGNITDGKVNEIIGNNSWTSLHCGECKNPVESVAVFNDEEYDFYLCKKCMIVAIGEME